MSGTIFVLVKKTVFTSGQNLEKIVFTGKLCVFLEDSDGRMSITLIATRIV